MAPLGKNCQINWNNLQTPPINGKNVTIISYCTHSINIVYRRERQAQVKQPSDKKKMYKVCINIRATPCAKVCTTLSFSSSFPVTFSDTYLHMIYLLINGPKKSNLIKVIKNGPKSTPHPNCQQLQCLTKYVTNRERHTRRRCAWPLKCVKCANCHLLQVYYANVCVCGV